jgi:hypothetical protein
MSELGPAGEEVALIEDEKRGSSNTTINPLLVQTLIDGISKTSNRPILQHWIDFILMTVPQFQQALYHLIFPLSDCICRQLRSALIDVHHVAKDTKGKGPILSTTTDAEFIMLLNALERLVLLSLTKTEVDNQEDDNHSEKAGAESSGLLGYVSNVFGTETPSNSDDQLSVS